VSPHAMDGWHMSAAREDPQCQAVLVSPHAMDTRHKSAARADPQLQEMLAQLVKSNREQQAHYEVTMQQMQEQQVCHEADMKLHQQRMDKTMALSEAEVGNALAGLRKMGLEHEKQKLELQRQVSELTLSLQERESQIRDRATRRATLEVTALQSRALEKETSELTVELRSLAQAKQDVEYKAEEGGGSADRPAGTLQRQREAEARAGRPRCTKITIELEGMTTLLNEAEGKNVKLSKDVSSLSAQVQDGQEARQPITARCR